MHDCFNVVAGEQRDIHKSFVAICSDREGTDMNDEFASHFHIGSQFRKICGECGAVENGMPKSQTSVIVHVLNGIADLEYAIEQSM